MASPSIAQGENLQILAWDQLQIGQLLGQGGYSEVHRGLWNGKEVAIKTLLLKKLPSDLISDFENETKIIAQAAKCLQIIKLFGVCMEEGHYAMVLEYMEKGSLYHVLRDEKIDLPWLTLRLKVAIDIGKGLSYLHDREILHRDLKSLNILLDANFNAKISDFGLSRIKLESKSTSTHTKSVGTIRWRPPELFKRDSKHTKASDVYSYGMILWEIASRKLPFSDSDDELTVMGWIKDGEQERIPSGTPVEFSKLISRTWFQEPEKRPSAQYVVLELEKLKPKPAAKSWHFDPETKSIADAMGKEYALIEASPKDIEKVKAFYAHHPVPGFEIGSVKIIYNPTFNRSFEAHMKKLQARHGNLFFDPKWSMNMLDPHLDWRQKVDEMVTEMVKPYIDPDYPNVKLLPLWHGTSAGAIESICKVGYANPTATDAGFFGRGLYGAHEAEYPYRVYCKGAFFLNWVAIYSAYPVIIGDQSKLEGKGNFENHDAHFIPVSPRNPGNPHEVNYDPCQPFAKNAYTEVVVFDSAACLPRYLVELRAIKIESPISKVVESTKPLLQIPPKRPSKGPIEHPSAESQAHSQSQEPSQLTFPAVAEKSGAPSLTSQSPKSRTLWEKTAPSKSSEPLLQKVPSLSCIKAFKGHSLPIKCLVVLGDGNLASSDDQSIKIWKMESGAIFKDFGISGGGDAILQMKNGMLVSTIVSKYERKINFWKLTESEKISIEIPCSDDKFKKDYSICTLAVSPTGVLVCGGSTNNTILKVQSNGKITEIKGHAERIRVLRFIKDGMLASGSEDKTIKLWDAKLNLLRTLEGHSRAVIALIELSDGSLVSSDGKDIKKWNPQDGSLLWTLSLYAHTFAILNDHLVCGGADISILDPKTGKALQTLKSSAKTLATLKDGTLLIANGTTIEFWK